MILYRAMHVWHTQTCVTSDFLMLTICRAVLIWACRYPVGGFSKVNRLVDVITASLVGYACGVLVLHPARS
jgi:hypothetical protein